MADTRKIKTRDRILEASLELILEQGYHATTLRQIADRIDMVAGGIYNHFKDKDEIFLAVLTTYHPWLLVPDIVREAEGETLDEFVRDASARAQETINNNKQLIKLHFIELVEFNGVHLPGLFEQAFHAMIEALKKKSAQYPGLNAGSIPQLSRALLGLFFSYMINDRLITGATTDNLNFGNFDYLTDIYLQGVISQFNTPSPVKAGKKS